MTAGIEEESADLQGQAGLAVKGGDGQLGGVWGGVQ